jgi:hypothetical protein
MDSITDRALIKTAMKLGWIKAEEFKNPESHVPLPPIDIRSE